MSDAAAWMREAIAEAHKALAADEVPIGAVVVHEPSGRIIGRGYNRRENDHDPPLTRKSSPCARPPTRSATGDYSTACWS
jgi:hypothetical protein